MWSLFCLAVAIEIVSASIVSRIPPLRLVNIPSGLQSRQLPNGSSFSNGTGIVPVTLSDDKQSYFTTIQLGDISFRVALDTASSDLWVMSSDCSTKTCNSVPKYPLGYESSTFVPVNANLTAFNISFEDNTSASGFVARESTQLANLTVPSQAFGLVTNSNLTLDDKISGILGLGFPRLSSISLSTANATPFFGSLAQQGKLDYPVLGLSLTRNSSGSLSLGAVDASVITNTSLIVWHDVVSFSPFGSESNTSSYLQWALPLTSFSVNGTIVSPLPTYPAIRNNQSVALLDVGTSGIYGPYQDVSRLFNLISGSRLVDDGGQWAIPCDNSETIVFTFGQQNITLQPSDYLIGPTTGNSDLCLTWPRALPPSSDGIDWQLGAAFLRTVYSVFSYGINTKEPPLIGLYPLNNASDPVESPDVVASFLSNASATIATTLPNFILPTPSFTTPPYAFNTSVSDPLGLVVSSGLATSTYSPVLGNSHLNATAIPTVTPMATLATFILTDSAGVVVTSTYVVPTPSVALGEPPGWNGGLSLLVPTLSMIFSCTLSWLLVLSLL